MYKKVLRVGALLIFTTILVVNNFPDKKEKILDEETIEQIEESEEVVVIETTKIVPDIEILLANHITYTVGFDSSISDTTLQLSYDDAQLLMMVAQAEAGNQGTEGMMLVMEVILNRVNDPEHAFGSNVHDVVFAKGQFESVANGSIYRVEISPECHMALAEIEKNNDYDHDIIAFETSANGRSLERYFKYKYTVGAHDFFSSKKN